MSLVYLITSLPRIVDDRLPPIGRAELIRRARQSLDGTNREQLELLLLLEEVDESSRIISEAGSGNPNVGGGELAGLLRTRRRRPVDAPPLETLPDWLLIPLPRHVQLRRTYQYFVERGGSFVASWGDFATDVEEVMTGLLARRLGLSPDELEAQMAGRFDASSEIIARRYTEPDLGLGRRFPWMPRVQAALESHDRLRTEREIDAIRLERIDELMGTETFSLETVLGIYLKLRILERHASWDPVAGRERLAHMLSLPIDFDAGSQARAVS